MGTDALLNMPEDGQKYELSSKEESHEILLDPLNPCNPWLNSMGNRRTATSTRARGFLLLLGSGPFQGEELLLGVQSAPVPGQRSVLADDSMARNDDRYRIVMIGQSDGAGRPRLTEISGDSAVAPGPSVGDLEKFPPD